MADEKPAADAKPPEDVKLDAAPGEVPKTADPKADEAGTTKDEQGKLMMHLKVFAPFKVYYEGDAYSISAVNESGPFDVLPRHHNFLCMLVPCDLSIVTGKETEVIKISRALMHVKAEKVTVYLDV